MMSNLHNKYSFSHTILFIVLLGYCASFISGGAFNQFLSLIPERIFNNFELWRLISFPFAAPPLESILLFSFSFYFVAPKIESVIKNKVFPILLLLLILLQGIIISLAFRDSNIVFSGADGISFFMIFLFAALSYNTKSIPSWFKPLKIGVLSLLMCVVWVAVLMFRIPSLESNVLISSSSNAVFGMFFSIITYVKIRADFVIRKRKKLEELNNQLSLIIPTPEELKYAMMGDNKRKHVNSFDDEIQARYSDEFLPDEDKLNEILDKMIDYGKDSLTITEQKYLENYSKTIK